MKKNESREGDGGTTSVSGGRERARRLRERE